MITEKCPKCGGRAHYEIDSFDVILKCMCGLHKYLRYTDDDITVETRLSKRDARLPKKGSKLSKVLGVIASTYPNTISTGLLVKSTGGSSNDVGSRVVVLFNRQLIDKVSKGKGLRGGSTWILSIEGRKLLGIIEDG